MTRLSEDMYTEEHSKLFRVSIESSGLCWWEPGGQFMSKCGGDVKYYPFDKQMCEMVFSNWIFTGVHAWTKYIQNI